MRYALRGATPYSYGEIAQRLAMTPEQIKAAENEALRLLCEPVGSTSKEAVAEIRLRTLCSFWANERYGGNIPARVKERLEYELKLISENRYSRYFLLAFEVAKFCKERSAPMLVRGCAGASLVAFVLGITQTDPLSAHFYCPRCGFTDFEYNKYFESGTAPNTDNCGIDMADASWRKIRCPECEEELIGDGHDLPIESFLGINGEKKPQFEIDVLPELVKDIQRLLPKLFNYDEILCADNDEEYLELFNIVFVNVDPILPLLNKLQHLTVISEMAVPMDNITYRDFFDKGMHADIPMLNEIPQEIIDRVRPARFSDIVRLLGFCNGTGVWENNAEKLYEEHRQNGYKKTVAHREDIMQTLMRHGIEREPAFRITETVSRGKASELSDGDISAMKDKGVSDEYIGSMMKIRSLSSKANDTEFAIRIFKLMWFRQHFPEQYARASGQN